MLERVTHGDVSFDGDRHQIPHGHVDGSPVDRLAVPDVAHDQVEAVAARLPERRLKQKYRAHGAHPRVEQSLVLQQKTNGRREHVAVLDEGDEGHLVGDVADTSECQLTLVQHDGPHLHTRDWRRFSCPGLVE